MIKGPEVTKHWHRHMGILIIGVLLGIAGDIIFAVAVVTMRESRTVPVELISDIARWCYGTGNHP